MIRDHYNKQLENHSGLRLFLNTLFKDYGVVLISFKYCFSVNTAANEEDNGTTVAVCMAYCCIVGVWIYSWNYRFLHCLVFLSLLSIVGLETKTLNHNELKLIQLIKSLIFRK